MLIRDVDVAHRYSTKTIGLQGLFVVVAIPSSPASCASFRDGVTLHRTLPKAPCCIHLFTRYPKHRKLSFTRSTFHHTPCAFATASSLTISHLYFYLLLTNLTKMSSSNTRYSCGVKVGGTTKLDADSQVQT